MDWGEALEKEAAEGKTRCGVRRGSQMGSESTDTGFLACRHREAFGLSFPHPCKMGMGGKIIILCIPKKELS